MLPPARALRKGKVGYEPPQAQWMQHPLMVANVMAARQQLVEAKVLLPSVLKTSVKDGGVHNGDNASCQQLCAAGVVVG